MLSILHKPVNAFFKAAFLMGVASSLFASQAFAQSPDPVIKTLSFTDTKVSSKTDWPATFTLSQFDSSLGTLLSVEVTIASNVTTTITVTNNTITDQNPAGSVTSGWVNTSYTFYLDDAIFGIGAPVISALSVPELTGFPTPRGLAYTLNPGQELTLDAASRYASDSKTYSTSEILAYFTGAGSVVLSGTTFTDTTLQNSGGNTGSDQQTYADAVVTVKYTYEAVPEPGTWAALALGAGVLAVSRRFRRKA